MSHAEPKIGSVHSRSESSHLRSSVGQRNSCTDL